MAAYWEMSDQKISSIRVVSASVCYVFTSAEHVCILTLYKFYQQCATCCVYHSRSCLYSGIVSLSCISNVLCVQHSRDQICIFVMFASRIISPLYQHSGKVSDWSRQQNHIMEWYLCLESDVIHLYICICNYICKCGYIGSVLTKHNSCITLWQPSPDEENCPGPRTRTYFSFYFYLGLSW